MNKEQMALFDQLFEEACSMPSAERKAWLDAHCSDPKVRAELESLIPYTGDQASGFSTLVGAAAAITHHQELQQQQFANLGPYRIVGLIGEGGMGAVYEGVRDDDQFRKRVAIKTLRLGVRTEPVLRRFRQERQILAELEHPNIARLLDGGTAADGTPYIVMERIDGEPLTAYADGRKLSIRQRLELFRQIANAVQYAHQKLIVHRDIKPGNILVDNDGVPKLLDFGIAKLLDAELAGAEALTVTGYQMMTPDYASPEQVQGQPVTVSSDVYSLGAVLYELLSGARPHGLKSYDPTEIAEKVCLREVSAPSLAGHPALRGDLDTIVLKAMQKDPTRRYQSVEQFAEDVRRYLEGRPVLARPDSKLYRFSKFARRNWLSLSAAAAVVIALAAGIAVSMYQARLAKERFELTRTLANRFLFDFQGEIANLPGSTKAQQMVVNTAVEYLGKLSQTAGSDPVILLDLAQAYSKLAAVQGGGMTLMAARFDDALASQKKSVELLRRLAAIDPAKRRMLARGLLDQTNIELRLAQTAAGLEHAQDAVRILDEVAAGPEGKDYKLLNEQATAHLYTSRMLKRSGRFEEALRSCVQAREKLAAVTAIDPSAAMRYRESIVQEEEGVLNVELGEIEAGITMMRKAYDTTHQLLAADPNNRTYKRHLFVLLGVLSEGYFSYEMLGKDSAAEAVPVHEERLILSRKLMESDTADGGARMDLAVAESEYSIPLIEIDPGKAAELSASAVRRWDEVLRATPGDSYATSRRARAQTRQAMALLRAKRLPDALLAGLESAETHRQLMVKKPNERFFQTSAVFALTTAADALTAAKRDAEAIKTYEEAAALATRLGQKQGESPSIAVLMTHAYSHFGEYWKKQGNRPIAKQWFTRSLDTWKARPEKTPGVRQRLKQAEERVFAIEP
jgi:serine/threonine protein kinase